MISQLQGNIVSIESRFLILNVNNVGYKIFCSSRSLSTFQENLENVLILTELVVREDSLTLYGFSDELERRWFNLLQSVQGPLPSLVQQALHQSWVRQQLPQPYQGLQVLHVYASSQLRCLREGQT